MKLRHKINFWLLPVLLLVTVSNGYPESQDNQQSEIVWHWTDDEHAERFIVFETTVDDKLISTAKFPVSKKARAQIKPEPKQQIFEYHFVLQKKKGRIFNDITHGKVEGNIWEAGMEKDGIIFGVSWVTDNQIMLNTLQFAPVDKIKTNKIDQGVYFKTYWVPKQKEKGN
jgi:hypothetical protein